MTVEVRDVANGLWLWRQPHLDWSEASDWEPEVASFAVESDGALVLLDPLAPPPSAREVWDRLEARRPDAIVVLKPDHVRALRALLDLPFEHVLVSHGEPVHTRADFEAALRRAPWSDCNGA